MLATSDSLGLIGRASWRESRETLVRICPQPRLAMGGAGQLQRLVFGVCAGDDALDSGGIKRDVWNEKSALFVSIRRLTLRPACARVPRWRPPRVQESIRQCARHAAEVQRRSHCAPPAVSRGDSLSHSVEVVARASHGAAPMLIRHRDPGASVMTSPRSSYGRF